MEQLSRYFRTISLIVESSGGIIDKFMGDAVMALWNAPGAVDDHAARACRAVLDIHAKADAITRALSGPGKPPLFTRFGLHSGQAVVGNVGSDDRKQYTALGATVNLASRIEGINKLFGTNCLVSAAVEEAVRGRFALRPLGPVVAVGTGAPMGLFELLGEAGDSAAAARIAAWEDAFAVWQARAWDAATQDFAGFLRDYPDDGPGRVFLARAEAYRDAPPPENWDGAIRADSK